MITRQQFEFAEERIFIAENRKYLKKEFDSLPDSLKPCYTKK